jgi:hypothetical protein
MQRDPVVRDNGFNRRAVFLIAAASISELLIDQGDRQPPGMIGLDSIRQLKQFPLGGLGCRERSIILEFHFSPASLSYLARASAPGLGISIRPQSRYSWSEQLTGDPPVLLQVR